MPKAKPDTSDDGISRISPEYTKDFEAKVKKLQKRFTGKERGALFEILQGKGVITENYTKEMWDNDFKAWKKNPNNGIFRHLGMVSAILEEVQMPAFEVFGGPHAKDTDDIVKAISSDVIGYLEKNLEGFKTFQSRGKRASTRKERIINRKAFENMQKIYDLIKENMGNYDPFFFLYSWVDSDLINPGIESLIGCKKKLVKKIFNSNFAPFYYAYFTQGFSGKKLLFHTTTVISGTEYLFNCILNKTLVIAYQLNSIRKVCDLYFHRKAMSHTISQKQKQEQASKKAWENPSPDNIPEESFSEEIEIDDTIAQINPISNIEERLYQFLGVSSLTDTTKESVKVLKRQVNEIDDVFVKLVDFLSTLENPYKLFKPFMNHEQQDAILKGLVTALKTVIFDFQNIMRFLNNPETDTTKKYSEYYTIDERHKRPIKIWKEYLVFSNSPDVLNLLDKNCSCLKNILNKISSLSEDAAQENNKITPTGSDSGSVKIAKNSEPLINDNKAIEVIPSDSENNEKVEEPVAQATQIPNTDSNKADSIDSGMEGTNETQQTEPPANHCNIPDEINEVIDEPEQRTFDIPLSHGEQLIQNELINEAINALLYDSESNKTEEPAQVPASDNPKIDFYKMQRQFFKNKRYPD